MAASANHQKQKLTLLKPRRLARSIVRQFIPLPQSPLKRLGFVGISVLTGVGVPALVFASHQQATPEKTQTTGSSTVTIQSTASSRTEEAVSSSTGPETHPPSLPDVTVAINGETIPTAEGSVSKQVTNSDGSQLDVSITVNQTTSSSSSTRNSTNIDINSSSSSTDGQDPVRGSPRR